MFLSLARVSKLSFQQFHRNLWLSIATITLLVLPLLVVNMIVTLGAVAQAATAAVQDKIDVSVYFKPEVKNEDVVQVQTDLQQLSEVKEVSFIPREGSLERFKERHKDDPVIMESLDALGENPFGATLAIKARDPEKYQRIVAFLGDEKYANLIEEKNFDDHQAVINKINALTNNVRKFGLAVAGLFAIIAVLIVINTVRVAVYTHRHEIRVMRLVGAGNWFIRGPFLFEAVLFSLIATLVTAVIVYPSLNVAQAKIAGLFTDVTPSLVGYYNAHLITIFGGQFLAVFLLTGISSFFAVRRYLHT